MNEQLLALICELREENKALRLSLANVLDRLAVYDSENKESPWELPVFERDQELETAKSLLMPIGVGKTLQ